MGIDFFSRASFYADPNGWVLDPTIPVSNPNMFTFGKPGMGKSATAKAFVLRMLGFGYKALILGDPKDEYETLCRALGVEPIAIGQGLSARINPLEFGPLGQGWDGLGAAEVQRRAAIVFARWLTLIRGLVGSQKIGQSPVPFGPSEETAVDAALKLLTGQTAAETPGWSRPPSRHCGTCSTNHPPNWSPPAATPPPATSWTRPGCSATPSDSWSAAASKDCSTATPPSHSTGLRPSSRCRCPAWKHSATKPLAWRCYASTRGGGRCGRRPPRATCGSWSATSRGNSSASGSTR